jgi:2-hydroxychromene-2-carboxylate isomerase
MGMSSRWTVVPTKFESNGRSVVLHRCNRGLRSVRTKVYCSNYARRSQASASVVAVLPSSCVAVSDMGVVIELKDQLADRSRPRGGSRAAFFYDLACPFSYLVAERVERVLGEVEWIPAPAVALDGGALWARFEAEQALAEREARAERLPLVWPDGFPANTRHALRVASYAGENGAGPGFALAAMRLAFCGGFDLEDPEIIGVAAAAAGLSFEGCLEAARDPSRDVPLWATARGLHGRGVRRLPAIRLDRRWLSGERVLDSVALLRASGL